MMAQATKCDRCGKFFDHHKDKKSTISFTGYDRENKYYIESEKFDLCPKCIESLEKWMNMEEDDD